MVGSSPGAAGGGTGAVPPVVVESPSLHEIVASRRFVGRRVRVTGRCLTTTGGHPLGAFRLDLDEWQLEADGVAVYVLGPRPAACGTNTSAGLATITAIVAEDTLPPIGDLPAAPRRYLAVVPAWAE